MKINIEEYYLRYGPGVYRRCLSLLGDEDRAYDALQEVFVKLMENRDRLHGTYPSSLLFRMATNICLNIIRDDRKNVYVRDDLLAGIAADECFESRYLARDFLDRIFHREKPTTKEIAVMHFIDKMTYREISSETGLSVSGIRKRLRVIRERLKSQEESLYET